MGLGRLLSRSSGQPAGRGRGEPATSHLAQLEQDAFARLLGEVRGQQILDLGCGSARGDRLLIERGARRVLALDTSLATLADREAFRHADITRLCATPGRLPLGAESCDTVVARRVLSKITDLDAVVEEAAAVLRPEGRLVITDVHPFVLLQDGAGNDDHDHDHSPRAHLVADYLETFARWGFELAVVEEPRWQGLPRVIALRAIRRAGQGRPPREETPLPASTFDGRLLSTRRPRPATLWRRLAREVDEGSAHLCELGWRSLFHLAQAKRTDVDRLTPTGDRRILVLAARPGDEMLGLAATLLAHRKAGDTVSIAHATDGRQVERILDLRRSQLAALRQHEAAEAAQLLDAEWHWLAEGDAAHDHSSTFDSLATKLGALLGELRPDILYAPSRVTARASIETVARALAAALGEAPDSLDEIRVYPLDVPLGPTLWSTAFPTFRAELSPLLANTYLSRQQSQAAALRRRRYDAELLGLPALLETFWELDPDRFRRLHRASAPPATVFHPLAQRPWTDPLAYLRGLAERRRLERLTLGV